MDYDWEFRVNTTSANVSWRSRLIGLLNSAYQPVEPAMFREMMSSLPIDFSQFTFVDIGSGKGRALLLASEYPFHKIIGLELLPELNAIAQENIRRFCAQHPSAAAIETICADATECIFPNEPLIVFFNNPLPLAGFRKVAENLRSWRLANRQPLFAAYANPALEEVLSSVGFRKLSGAHQYSIFAGME